MRLIDADALLERMRKDPLFPLVERYGVSGVINAEPTVHAVEVVRCKDCKHRPAFRDDEDGNRYVEGPRYQETLKNGLTVTLEDTGCPCVNGLDSYFSYIPKDDWFCKNGERRDEE